MAHIVHVGKVTSLKPDGLALVEIENKRIPRNSCASCAMASTCIPTGHGIAVEAAFDRLADIDTDTLTGQRVRVESRTGGIQASLLLFGLPLAALVSTVAITKNAGMTDDISGICGFCASAAAMFIPVLFRRRFRRSLWHITAIIDNKIQTPEQ